MAFYVSDYGKEELRVDGPLKKYILIGLGSLSISSDMLVVVNSQYKTQIWPTLYVNFNF